jgi:hypothetical protein
MTKQFLNTVRSPSLVVGKTLMVAGTVLILTTAVAKADCQLSREWLRREFETAKESGPGVIRLLDQIRAPCEVIDQAPVVTRAYYGALLTLKAKYSRNPTQKLEALDQGMTIMDKTVLEAPGDVEVVFLRFAALHSMPGFLSDRKKRTRDLETVCQLLEQRDYQAVDKPAQLDMVVFLLDSDRLTNEQEERIKKIQHELSGP